MLIVLLFSLFGLFESKYEPCVFERSEAENDVETLLSNKTMIERAEADCLTYGILDNRTITFDDDSHEDILENKRIINLYLTPKFLELLFLVMIYLLKRFFFDLIM